MNVYNIIISRIQYDIGYLAKTITAENGSEALTPPLLRLVGSFDAIDTKF